MHDKNPAAKELEARWRMAIKNKSLTLTPLEMTGEETEGYEPLRKALTPTDSQVHFPHSFKYGSQEYQEWLLASDEL